MKGIIEKKEEYLDYLDFAKGIGILLVIAGHSLFPLHFAIDIFHMPLFFLLAGITFHIPTNRSEFLLKKIDRIFIPWGFFSIVSALFRQIVPPIKSITEPFNGPLWFLQTIFTALLLYMLICMYCKKEVIIHIIIFLISFYIYVLAKNHITILPFSIDRALLAVVFIHIGKIVKKHNMYVSMNVWRIIVILTIMAIIYCIGLYFFYKNYAGVEGEHFLSLATYSHNYFLFWFTCLSAIFVVLIVSMLIKKMQPLNWLGKHSLIILCVHFPFIQRLNQFIASTSLYSGMGIHGKVFAGLIVYSITIAISVFFIIVCRRYIPALTGYKWYFYHKNNE